MTAPRIPWRLVGAAAVVLLALVATAVAVVAPFRAPTDADWEGAARAVRAGFQPGDLIVAAPAWADPILRQHLGDLIPAEMAGRLDDARYGRVWEVSQRGARSPEGARGAVAFQERSGALTVRRIERAPEPVTFDFVARWGEARVSRRESRGTMIPCGYSADRFQCPNLGFNYVRRQIVEVDTRLRMALLAQPVGNATVVVEFPRARVGRKLAVGTGLHNVWMRKEAQGPVDLRVFVGDAPVAAVTTRNQDGWKPTAIDTSAWAGRTVPVRFEITSPAPYARHFAFAAEARE